MSRATALRLFHAACFKRKAGPGKALQASLCRAKTLRLSDLLLYARRPC